MSCKWCIEIAVLREHHAALLELLRDSHSFHVHYWKGCLFQSFITRKPWPSTFKLCTDKSFWEIWRRHNKGIAAWNADVPSSFSLSFLGLPIFILLHKPTKLLWLQSNFICCCLYSSASPIYLCTDTHLSTHLNRDGVHRKLSGEAIPLGNAGQEEIAYSLLCARKCKRLKLSWSLSPSLRSHSSVWVTFHILTPWKNYTFMIGDFISCFQKW